MTDEKRDMDCGSVARRVCEVIDRIDRDGGPGWGAMCEAAIEEIREIVGDDPSAYDTEQESVDDDSDLIDEDPIPFGSAVDLPSDRCWLHDQRGRSVAVRRRDAWAHWHGWPELARYTEEKSVDQGGET